MVHDGLVEHVDELGVVLVSKKRIGQLLCQRNADFAVTALDSVVAVELVQHLVGRSSDEFDYLAQACAGMFAGRDAFELLLRLVDIAFAAVHDQPISTRDRLQAIGVSTQTRAQISDKPGDRIPGRFRWVVTPKRIDEMIDSHRLVRRQCKDGQHHTTASRHR